MASASALVESKEGPRCTRSPMGASEWRGFYSRLRPSHSADDAPLHAASRAATPATERRRVERRAAGLATDALRLKRKSVEEDAAESGDVRHVIWKLWRSSKVRSWPDAIAGMADRELSPLYLYPCSAMVSARLLKELTVQSNDEVGAEFDVCSAKRPLRLVTPDAVLTMIQHPSKRPRPNVGSALRRGPPGPDFAKGVKYWDDIDATVDGMLGGFGTGVSLPLSVATNASPFHTSTSCRRVCSCCLSFLSLPPSPTRSLRRRRPSVRPTVSPPSTSELASAVSPPPSCCRCSMMS